MKFSNKGTKFALLYNMKGLFYTILLFQVFAAFAQTTQKDVVINEVELVERLNKLRSAKTDVLLKAYSDSFKLQLLEELEKEVAREYPFEQLTSIGKLMSNDKTVRVFSWNYQKENDANVYTAIISRYDKRKKKTIITELKKNEFGIRADEKSTLTPDNWYGCLYYDIIEVKKGSRDYYTLLGYDAGDGLTHTKLVDVLYFSGSTPKLGYNLFKIDDKIQKRVFMEHAKKATMTLRYDSNRDKIVFDHLSPESEGLAAFREYWVPDMSYDAMNFTNGKWIVEQDIIAINKEKQNKITISTYDEKNDTIKAVTIKDNWESPGGKHTIALPKESKDKKSKARTKKKKDPDFNGVSYGTLGRKKKKKQ